MAKAKINSAGARKLLRSEEVRRMLEAEARTMAALAGPGFAATSEVGPNRARAEVFARSVAARKAEAESRALTIAMGSRRRK